MKREEIKWHDRDHTKSADDSLSGPPIWSPAPSAFRIQCPLAAFYCAQTCSSKFYLLTPCQTMLAFPIAEPAFHLLHDIGQPKKWFSQLRISHLSVKNFWIPFPLGNGVNQAVNVERKGKNGSHCSTADLLQGKENMGMVVHASNASTREEEAGRSLWVERQHDLHTGFQARPDPELHEKNNKKEII